MSSTIAVPPIAVEVLAEGASAVRDTATEAIHAASDDRAACTVAWRQCTQQWELSDALGTPDAKTNGLQLGNLYARAIHDAASMMVPLLDGWLRQDVPDADSALRMRMELDCLQALVRDLAPLIEPVLAAPHACAQCGRPAEYHRIYSDGTTDPLCEPCARFKAGEDAAARTAACLASGFAAHLASLAELTAQQAHQALDDALASNRSLPPDTLGDFRLLKPAAPEHAQYESERWRETVRPIAHT